MTLTGMLLLLFLAAILTTLAQIIIGYNDVGWVVSEVLGFVGGFLGLLIGIRPSIPPIIRFHIGSEPFPIVWVLLGTGFFVLIVTLVQKRIIRHTAQ